MKSNKDWKLYTYEDAVAYIEEIPRFTKKHSLAHTREFLRRLGNPAADRKLIHVAGTNGKGSVCAYLKEILRAEGRKTGFFTSPHLVCINERIEIDGTQVDNGTFLRIFQTTAHAAWQMQEELNTIAGAYPALPKIDADGIFGPATREAVRDFQSVFGLPATGIVDYPTWYKISEIYVGVSRIAELS